LLVGGHAGASSVFLTWEDYNKVMHTSLGHGAQMFFKHKGKKLATLLFFFIVLVHISA